jgi:methionine aminopeptidase
VCGVGVTTDEIDRVVHEACIERECYPSPLNYHNFPNSCCTSVNEVICHGIPDLRPLQVNLVRFSVNSDFLKTFLLLYFEYYIPSLAINIVLKKNIFF